MAPTDQVWDNWSIEIQMITDHNPLHNIGICGSVLIQEEGNLFLIVQSQLINLEGETETIILVC